MGVRVPYVKWWQRCSMCGEKSIFVLCQKCVERSETSYVLPPKVKGRRSPFGRRPIPENAPESKP